MRRFALRKSALVTLVAVALLALACSDPNASLPGKPPPITKEGGAPGGANAAMATPKADAGAGAPAAAAPAATEPDAVSADPLVAKGKSVYGSVCIACHNMDPNLAGAIGPDVAGSSLELLKTKVLKNGYPDGYTPKRDTLTMVPLPHLEPDLPAVAAYLASVKGS